MIYYIDDCLSVYCWYGWCTGTVYGYRKKGGAERKLGGNGLDVVFQIFVYVQDLVEHNVRMMTELNLCNVWLEWNYIGDDVVQRINVLVIWF